VTITAATTIKTTILVNAVFFILLLLHDSDFWQPSTERATLYCTAKNSATLYFVQSPRKVKHGSEPAHLAGAADIGLVLVACAASVGAFVMRLVDRPPGWLVLAVVGSMSALGLAGASFIADFAETRAKPLHHKEEY
jgi:threonine dehydrogenase-like Zn-dependent dehydrogenase